MSMLLNATAVWLTREMIEGTCVEEKDGAGIDQDKKSTSENCRDSMKGAIAGVAAA